MKPPTELFFPPKKQTIPSFKKPKDSTQWVESEAAIFFAASKKIMRPRECKENVRDSSFLYLATLRENHAKSEAFSGLY